MTETQIAYLAGVLTGRGTFGSERSREWVILKALDPEIAESALHEWGGTITRRASQGGDTTIYKWSVSRDEARDALAAMAPYLMGKKREQAAELFEYGSSTV